MKIKQKVSKKVNVLKDIICDSCGKSCKTPINTLEFMELKARWGYGTKKDMEQWTAHICETCVDEKFKFIKFKKEEMKLQTSISTDEEHQEVMDEILLTSDIQMEDEEELNLPLNTSDTMNNSLKQLVRTILSDCKLDPDEVEESDPEFKNFISNEILKWHNENKHQ